ncbi:MAG: signal recognition particle-docking protein FtsY [Candidatus Iainarchaeum archaeon]|uniref:Signal recognition particle receptor FtsY n=1 Tax=Candidatus Iainarchaeum sp. TaxID=3101447 RepID=A0A7T9DJY5_9ARCH|nr:MAG: signal recognition particle-docking protein FtsY [Candidatus Diapherotrites archaeon]
MRMFDLLKKKIQSFTQKIIGASAEETRTPTPSEPTTTSSAAAAPTPAPIAESKPIPATPAAEPASQEATPLPADATSTTPAPTHAVPAHPTQKPEAAPAETKPIATPIPPRTHEPKLPEMKQEEKRELKASVGIGQQVVGFFTGNITLKPETTQAFLEEFELSLLEADVNIATAAALIEKLRERLSEKTIPRGKNPTQFILQEIREAMHELVSVEALDFDSITDANHPCIVLIIGPNGAGKTTSIAKLTHYLQQRGKKVVLASADTFRAGSIEQLQLHADKLHVRLVRHQYGSDPAAVAFDAVKAAKAENADVVLIDSAGRQDTNKNLLEEMKKITRVVQPHLKLYVGESFTGQAILTQAQTFDETIGIDGFILTKLDTDAKGGGVISILHELHKPIVFFGVGQAYADLIKFDLDTFLERIIPRDA